MTFDNRNNRFSQIYLTARHCAEMLVPGMWKIEADFGGQVNTIDVEYFQNDGEKLFAKCVDGQLREISPDTIVAVHLPR